MYGPQRPMILNNMHSNYHQPPHNPRWRHPGGPRAPFRGQHQHFNHHRPAYLPGNDNYWCETCDRGFPTEDILSKHLQQHERCNIDGCQFVAHPKVITKHIQMQHSSGLYKKIANINRPEEIKKWRAERKKKFPTKANIDKKAAELKERIDRGEKMGLDRNKNRQNKDDSGQNKDNRPHYNDNRPGQGLKRRNNMGNENHSFKKRDTNPNKKPPPPPKTLPLVEDNRKLNPFPGILSLQMDSDSEIEDTTEAKVIDIIDDDCEELVSIETKSVETCEPIVCGALSSLMCDYGSSDEDKDTKDKESDINQEPLVVAQESTRISKEQSAASVRQDDERSREREYNHILKNKEVNETGTQIDSLEVLNKHEAEIINKKTDQEQNMTQKNKDDNDSGPEEVKVVKQDSIIISPPENSKPKHVVVRKRVTEKKQIYNRPKSKVPSTLLQKLLSKEIQQERNIVLQCIRYVRSNNYFDKDE